MVRYKLQPWKTLAKKTILTHSKYLIVESHTVALPNGRVLNDWPWIITPNFVIVIPVTDEGTFYCFRQVKYSVGGTSLAPVGGYIETGENPLAAAQRELQEEMGLAGREWVSLGQYEIDGNRGIATCHLYLARGAYRCAIPKPDDLEEQELVSLSIDELKAALKAGEIKVLPWAAAVSMALLHIQAP
jgi:ADP-ribose pyrophosphatase